MGQQQRPVATAVMAMHHMLAAKPAVVVIGIALGQQHRCLLLAQRQQRIDAGMHIDPMRILIEQRPAVEPGDVMHRHLRGIAAIGCERGVAAFRHPVIHGDVAAQRRRHQRIVIALQHRGAPQRRHRRPQPRDHPARIRPLVHVIAEHHQRQRIPRRMRIDPRQRAIQQIAAAVQIGNDVSHGHCST